MKLLKPLHKWFIYFVIRFAIIFTILVAIYSIASSFNALEPLQNFEAAVIYSIVKPFAPAATLDGILIGNIAASPFIISDACLGILPTILFISLVIGLPNIPPRKFALPLIIGIVLLAIFNFFRVAFTILSYEFFGNSGFQLAHGLLFKLGFFIALPLIFIFVFKKFFWKHISKNINQNSKG